LNTRVLVQGRSLEVEWWGPRISEQASIVLLHEGLGSVAMWRDVPAAIAERTGRRVMAYSRFGHGQSEPPLTPHTVRFMHDEAALLPEIFDITGIRSAILLGHSDGGSIALVAASQQPTLVDGLILEAPHVFVEDISIKSIERVRRHYAETHLRQRLARFHADVDVAFRGWSEIWLDPAFRTWNLEEFLPTVTCPVLLIQGELDDYGTLRQIDTIANRVAGPVERLILPECGHSPHRDKREQVMEAIARFIARQEGEPSP
jgi:pimeloyl-ACP methyl ester carboxylesterase